MHGVHTQHEYHSIDTVSTILVGLGSVTYAIHSLSVVLDTSIYIPVEYTFIDIVYIGERVLYSSPEPMCTHGFGAARRGSRSPRPAVLID